MSDFASKANRREPIAPTAEHDAEPLPTPSREFGLHFIASRAVTASQEAGLVPSPGGRAPYQGYMPSNDRELRNRVTEYVYQEFRDDDRPWNAPWKSAFRRYANRSHRIDQWGLVALLKDAGLLTDDDLREDSYVRDVIRTIFALHANGERSLSEDKFRSWVGLRGTTTA